MSKRFDRVDLSAGIPDIQNGPVNVSNIGGWVTRLFETYRYSATGTLCLRLPSAPCPWPFPRRPVSPPPVLSLNPLINARHDTDPVRLCPSCPIAFLPSRRNPRAFVVIYLQVVRNNILLPYVGGGYTRCPGDQRQRPILERAYGLFVSGGGGVVRSTTGRQFKNRTNSPLFDLFRKIENVP